MSSGKSMHSHATQMPAQELANKNHKMAVSIGSVAIASNDKHKTGVTKARPMETRNRVKIRAFFMAGKV
jgi:hypothetical protein